jgi:hypothetical protein
MGSCDTIGTDLVGWSTAGARICIIHILIGVLAYIEGDMGSVRLLLGMANKI